MRPRLRVERKAVAVPRDGDSDGWIDDGKPTMRPAPPRNPLRVVLPQEAAIAKGAARVAAYRDEARGWPGTVIDGLVYGWGGEFTTRNGRRVRSIDVRVNEEDDFGRIGVEGELQDVETGRILGVWTRAIQRDWSGDDRGGVSAVDHTQLSLFRDYQAEGIGTDFNAHAVAWYRELGIGQITVHATGSGDQTVPTAMFGGYVWGQQGYDWAELSEFTGTRIGRLVAKVQDGGDTDDAAWWLRHDTGKSGIPPGWWVKDNVRWTLGVLRAIDPDDPPTPYELGELGRDRPFIDTATGQPTWFGKALMSRSSWDGVFRLEWLDVYPETKTVSTRRTHLLAGVFLAALGGDAADRPESGTKRLRLHVER